jgi:anion-transporting  ArsA/GET3 family ATPase
VKPVLERDLLFVTGKGGVGRTTVCAALGLVAAGRGRRTVVVEVGAQQRLPRLFGRDPATDGREVALRESLWSISIDPQVAVRDYLGTQLPRPLVRLLADSRTFSYLYAAAPGAREVATLGGVWDLLHGRMRRDTFELVIVDAPATGHALGLVRSPRTVAEIARVGPVRNRSERIRALLADGERTAYTAVTTLGELPVAETLELQAALGAEVGREPELVVANGVYPRRFSPEDLAALATLDGEPGARAAVAAARSQAARVQAQRRELSRLRRHASGAVATLPYVFEAELGLPAVERLGAELARKV